MRYNPAQDSNWKLGRAINLRLLLDCPAASLAAAVAGSSLPRVALELAASLESEGDPEAAEQVGSAGGVGLLLWLTRKGGHASRPGAVGSGRRRPGRLFWTVS